MNEKNHPEDYTFRFTIRETIGLILAFCGDHEVTDAEAAAPRRGVRRRAPAADRAELSRVARRSAVVGSELSEPSRVASA